MTIDNFRRPSHPDFMDMFELAAIRFSGVRHNSISDYMEVWVDGVRKMEMPYYKYGTPEWDKEYAELFGLHNVETVSQKGN